MRAATLKIGPEERDTLHRLMLHRLLILGQRPCELARKEGITLEQLCEEFGEDLRLMEDIGWVFESDRELIALTMPRESLASTLRRLRRDARRAPSEERHEREPEGTDEERWKRFGRAVETCERLLGSLGSVAPDERKAIEARGGTA